MIKEYSKILDEHKYRNSGSDLEGFAVDVEHYLTDLKMFSKIDFAESYSDDCMVSVVCKLKESQNINDARIELERIWLEYLCYKDFEMHSFKQENGGFAFYFITKAKNLGVVGKIECKI